MTDYFTDADLAEKLREPDVDKVIAWRRAYGWPHLKIGRQVRYTEADLRAIEALHRVEGTKVTVLPGQTKRSAARSA